MPLGKHSRRVAADARCNDNRCIKGQAVAETTGLYGLVVAIILMFVKPFG